MKDNSYCKLLFLFRSIYIFLLKISMKNLLVLASPIILTSNSLNKSEVSGNSTNEIVNEYLDNDLNMSICLNIARRNSYSPLDAKRKNVFPKMIYNDKIGGHFLSEKEINDLAESLCKVKTFNKVFQILGE